MQLAEVVYLDDRLIKIIPVAYIRYNRNDDNPIKPINDNDFESEHVYFARWYHCGKNGSKCDEQHVHDYNTFKAKIFHLGGLYIT